LTLENDKALRELVLKAALLNALQHGGKAQASALMGRIIGERQDLKTKAKELSGLIGKVVSEVNSLSIAEQKRKVEEKWPEALKKEKAEKEEKRLPPLPNANKYKKIVTRFSPNPDCVLHLGSARAIILSHEYARLYKGKFILRFEDTDPKVKKPVLEFYDRIREDLDWLRCKPDEEYIQSGRLKIYYDYAERLLREGNAYVCTCRPEQFRKKSRSKEPCNCRSQSTEENLERWQRMLDGGYGEGEAVVRVKTDIKHPNPAVRDWPALRIIDPAKYPHPKVGSEYRVWPLYNMAAGVDDHELGITHIIRGKEHLTNQVRQEYMYKHLGWKYPETIHYGRLKITGAFLSKSKIVQGVREGFYTGWDDPRLATFAALRKRGITPEAIKKMIIDVGPKTADVTLSWETLYSYNRKILDPESSRYFFVADPIILAVKNVLTFDLKRPLNQVFNARLHIHPEKHKRKFRRYRISLKGEERIATFWIDRKDAENIVGKDFYSHPSKKLVRLMELFNIKIENAGYFYFPSMIEEKIEFIEARFVSVSYKDVRKAKTQLIHWVPMGKEYPCVVVMPNNSKVEGLAESACEKLKPDTVIQFERFGFVRVDKNDAKLTAYYAHK
jgi:glutamyl-tRNA synthetase